MDCEIAAKLLFTMIFFSLLCDLPFNLKLFSCFINDIRVILLATIELA